MGKGFGAATSSNRSSQAADRFFDRAVEALGRSDQTGALLALRAALAAQPTHVPSLNELGAVMLSNGDATEALGCFERALPVATDAQRPQVLNNLACALLELQRPEAALERLDLALTLLPDHAQARCQRGVTLQALGRLPEAQQQLEQAVQANPSDPKALVNLALVHQELDQLQAALASAKRAFERAPNDHNIRWLLATLLLASGRAPQAWPLFESRLFADNAIGLYAYPDLPAWNPSSEPPPPTLLLVAEQGLGDCLMWLRFLPLLRPMCQRIALCGPASLQIGRAHV